MSLPRLAFFCEYFSRGFTHVLFIAFKTCLLTSLTKTNLVHPNVTISATHLIITTTALPAERQVKVTIRVSLYCLPVLFARLLLMNMALSKGLRLHQYLDDWLIRSQSREKALVNTQAVIDLTQSLGWIINQQKSELNPTQVFSFVGYEYHLDSALVKPTQER